ncbi:MAG: sigma-70 family RNA polymerase sigma factor [Candidatus Latescibacterota bacterium]|nr:sigma-70 family RNA polymerase sigma factor [Candidatus Latescibacterota bacterium]
MLLARLKAGEDRAFDDLVREYQERIIGFAHRLVGDFDDACDVAQETFIKAHQAIGNFRGDAVLYTWLYRIAHNQAISLLRRRKILSFLRLDIGAEEPSLVAPERTDAGVECREVTILIQRAIADLPPRQRSIFVMRNFEGMSHGEIAAIVGSSDGAVRAGYFHAVRKLRKALHATGQFDERALKSES